MLDVREPHEYQICNLGGHLIPLGDLPKRVSELDSSREIVVHCKMGGRSAKAVAFLQQSGFTKVHNLVGGIGLFGPIKVDPKVPVLRTLVICLCRIGAPARSLFCALDRC